MPSTPFIGVRISWLMLARNSSFERVSASALRSPCSSSRVRSMICWREETRSVVRSRSYSTSRSASASKLLASCVSSLPRRERPCSGADVRSVAYARRLGEFLEGLHDLALQRIGREEPEQDAERQHEGHLRQALGGGGPRRPVIDEECERARTLRFDLDRVLDVIGLEPQEAHRAMRHARAVRHRAHVSRRIAAVRGAVWDGRRSARAPRRNRGAGRRRG